MSGGTDALTRAHAANDGTGGLANLSAGSTSTCRLVVLAARGRDTSVIGARAHLAAPATRTSARSDLVVVSVSGNARGRASSRFNAPPG
jgi:hypothetical protein